MPAPVAAWTRQLLRAQPARAADELRFSLGSRGAADGARGREQEVEEGASGIIEKDRSMLRSG